MNFKFLSYAFVFEILSATRSIPIDVGKGTWKKLYCNTLDTIVIFDCVEFWYTYIIGNSLIIHLTGDQEYHVVEDDILIYDQHDVSYKTLEQGSFKEKASLWAKKESYVKIPYEIEKEANPDEVSEIEKAIQEFTNNTCIRYHNVL